MLYMRRGSFSCVVEQWGVEEAVNSVQSQEETWREFFLTVY